MRISQPYDGVASAIVEKFGGPAKVARMLSIPDGTVRSWTKTGVIPEPYRPKLISLAKERGIPHTPLDYVAYLMPLAV